MPEPTNSLLTVISSGIITWLMTVFGGVSGVDASFAFAGAVIFIVVSKELKFLEKITLSVLSFIIGMHSADFVANIVNAITPDFVTPSRAIGALLSSALSVNLIMFLVLAVKNPIEFANKIITLINKFRGKENNESE